MTNLAIKFLGRQATRESSEHRRLSILKAVLRIIVKEGVRGVRHRAVAKEAGVPLSATTYYFKDIHDLLADAFALFVKEQMEAIEQPFWNSILDRMNAYEPEDISPNSAARDRFLDEAMVAGSQYIFDRVTKHYEHVKLEAALWYAAIQDYRIMAIASKHSINQHNNMLPVMRFLQVKEPDLAVRAITSTARRLEYESMINGPDREYIKRMMSYQIKAVVNV